MAPTPPTTTTAQDNADFIINVMRQQAVDSNKLDPKMQQFLDEMRITLRSRLALSEDQGNAMRELFLYRKDAAKKITDNVLEIGHKASQSELDLYAAAEKFKLETATKAAGANLSNLNIIEEKKAGWSGFWTIAADLCRGIGFDAGANWCQERADANKPKILTANLEELNRLKAQVAIDTKSPIGRAMGVFSSSVASLDPDTAGVGPDAGSQMHRNMDRARQSNSLQTPTHIQTPTTTASAGSVEQMTTEILKRIANDARLSEDMIKKITRDVVGIDRSGSKDGKLNTPAELQQFETAMKERQLDAGQSRKVREALGLPAPQPN